MPYCYASNIKAAKILGIILAILYGLGIVYAFKKPFTPYTLQSLQYRPNWEFYRPTAFEFSNIFSIITGFLGVASTSILAYGAFTRNSKAMQIYIYSTILMIILFIAEAIWAVVDFFDVPTPDHLSKLEEIFKQKMCDDEYGSDVNRYQICLDTQTNNWRLLNDVHKTAGPIAQMALIFVVVIAVVQIIFIIWTIFVAKNAKKEIEAEKQDKNIELNWIY